MKSKFKLTAIAMTLAAALTSPLAAQELTLKLGHLANEQNSWHKASVKFGQELSRLTQGRIAVEV